MASPKLFSSMFMWKVSRWIFTWGLATASTRRTASGAVLMKSVSKRFNGSSAIVRPWSPQIAPAFFRPATPRSHSAARSAAESQRPRKSTAYSGPQNICTPSVSAVFAALAKYASPFSTTRASLLVMSRSPAM
ncbi:MAG: hypothetical protein ABSG21_13525 [Spirochaetia bacterium]